jgi:hypothetical protein
MPEHGGGHGGQPDPIDDHQNRTVAKPAGSLSHIGREALANSLAALVDSCAALRVRSIAEPANIVCTLIWTTINLADAVKIAVKQLRAEGERQEDISTLLNKASKFVSADFDGAWESVSSRFGPSWLRLILEVDACNECHGPEAWTEDPPPLKEHPLWFAASEEDREAHRAMEGLECLALSLSVLNDMVRPDVDSDGDIPF